MQIVIDIPKEMYINALNGYLCGSKTIVNAIENGTPLPNEHGRLIDADEYLRKICTYKDTGCGSCNFQCECIADEPTIIKSNKKEERRK